ncbi:MAG: YihY/virulence factor BrkB family protein [Chitinophagaceae bacterium]|nr:MAG: YihY/virulence factor BrkB family protein [Chitinophagaceae bacterium]
MAQTLPSKIRSSLVDLSVLFKRSFAILTHNDPLRMAGATAFFTSFALPFILILLTQFLSLLFDPMKIRRELFQDLSSILGRDSVQQLVDTLIAFRQLAYNVWITLFGFLFLLMVATTLLMVVKGSINQLWRIKVEEGRSFIGKLRTRLQSILIIVGTGILIIVSILAEAIRLKMNQNISDVSPTIAFYINSGLTYFLSLLFVTLWFGIIFRLLPDARPSWKVSFTGAFVTAILFIIGRYLLRLLLINSNIGTLYGASGSIVLVLLFVFYSSLILYFGAAFTHECADYLHQPIKPLPYAKRYKVEELRGS